MNLGTLMEEVCVACGLQVLRRAATGGSTTTVVDSGILNRRPDGYYAQGEKGGHLVFISDTTDDLAPIHQFGEVSSFTLSASTPTFTIPTLTAAVASGDIYAVMKPEVQLYELIGRINAGLRRLTEQERVDTSLTTLAETIAYNLPAGIRASNILGIEIGNDTDGWGDVTGYSVTPKSGASLDQLIFVSQPATDSTTPANQTIKIRYQYVHPTLSVYSDSVEKSVHDELAVAVCTKAVMELIMRKRPSSFSNKARLGLWNDIQMAEARAMDAFRVNIKPAEMMKRHRLRDL